LGVHDERLYERLGLVLRVGVAVSLTLLVAGLVVCLAAGREREGVILVSLGILTMFVLPAAQSVLALVTYRAEGNRKLALAALGLLVVQVAAVAAAVL
jgi:uncharacterized membrane protein